MREQPWWRTWLGMPPPGTWHRVQTLEPEERFQRLDRWRLRVSVGDAESVDATVLAQPGAGAAPIVLLPTDTLEGVIGTEGSDEASAAALEEALTPEQREQIEYRQTQARRHAGVHLAKRGFVTVSVPWRFGEPEITGPEHPEPSYRPAADAHARQHATMTGLGAALADLDAVLDAVPKLPVGDPARIGCYGIGVGGKLALHASALDERIQAAVIAEAGLGFAHSNWSDPWFYGKNVPLDRDQHELLTLIPPRRALLLLGGRDDNSFNGYQRDLARRAVGGAAASRIEEIAHTGGTAPPWWVLKQAYDWLETHLGTP